MKSKNKNLDLLLVDLANALVISKIMQDRSTRLTSEYSKVFGNSDSEDILPKLNEDIVTTSKLCYQINEGITKIYQEVLREWGTMETQPIFSTLTRLAVPSETLNTSIDQVNEIVKEEFDRIISI